MFTHIPLCSSELHWQWSIHSLQEQKTDHHLVFHHNHPAFFTEKTCTYSSDQAVVVWTRLNNDLFTLLILSVVHWLMALCQHSLHTDLATLLILKPSWHTCSIPHPHTGSDAVLAVWCHSALITSPLFLNGTGLTACKHTQTHSCFSYCSFIQYQLLLQHAYLWVCLVKVIIIIPCQTALENFTFSGFIAVFLKWR